MQGTMLWFNRDKGYGFIQTEDDERLFVARRGFLPGHFPESRCKGSVVTFDREVAGDDAYAVNVSFVTAGDPRRARLRTPRGGHAI
jgi:cold shock CspA family protein